MNFTDFVDKIKTYVADTLPDYLEAAELKNFDGYIDDFIDLDKYKQKTLLFFDFEDMTFRELSLGSLEVEQTMHIYIVLRGQSADNLRALLRKYTTAFYTFFYDPDKSERRFSGIIDNGLINDVIFFDAALGNENIKVADISINMKVEDCI